MPTVLESIVAGVREDLASRAATVPVSALSRMCRDRGAVRLFDPVRSGVPGVIAEVKRSSPSKGVLSADLDPVATARAYVAGGACAVSVLTERRRFGGSLDDLSAVSAATGDVPVLRKDFILDAYMVAEARAFGADLVLLMVSVLGKKTADLMKVVGDFGLQALVEVHDKMELDVALSAGATLIGVNNRNLADLSVDLATSRRLIPRMPDGVIRVVESGISTPEQVRELTALGAHAFLVGEALVVSGDPEAGVRRLRGEAA